VLKKRKEPKRKSIAMTLMRDVQGSDKLVREQGAFNGGGSA